MTRSKDDYFPCSFTAPGGPHFKEGVQTDDRAVPESLLGEMIIDERGGYSIAA
jgi:hypothetical protein